MVELDNESDMVCECSIQYLFGSGLVLPRSCSVVVCRLRPACCAGCRAIPTPEGLTNTNPAGIKPEAGITSQKELCIRLSGTAERSEVQKCMQGQRARNLPELT